MVYEKTTHYIFDNHLDFVFFDKQTDRTNTVAHFHPYCQIIIPEGEDVFVTIGNNAPYQLSGNNLLLLLPFVRHKVHSLPDSSFSSLAININRLGKDFISMPYMRSINQMMTQKTSGLLFHGETASQIKQLFSSMENFIEIEYMATVFRILSLSANGNEYSLLAKDELYPTDIKDIQFCTTISNYIVEHLDINIEIARIASVMHMSQSTFIRQFNRFFNQTFHTYVLNKKIETACYFLFTTKISIQKISEELGFSSLSHFIETFKRLRNVTPTKYRRNQQYIAEQDKEYIQQRIKDGVALSGTGNGS